MRIDPINGGKCTHPLRIEVEDGVSLTEADVLLIEAYFGSGRVVRDHSCNKVVVCLYLWTSVSVPQRTLRGAGYGALLDLDDVGSGVDLAREIGRQILGCEVEILGRREPNCEARVFARCSLDDFEKACCK